MSASGEGHRLAKQYAERYGDAHPKILRHLIAWVLLMREGFDGDLDLMVVLAVIGDRAMADPSVKGYSYQGLIERKPVMPRVPLTNRKSIADSTGIPRETVRRKVATLIARGWVEELPDGSLIPTIVAKTELHSTTLHSFEVLGRLAEALQAVTAKDTITVA
jgi:hypothetical protein